MPTGGGKPQERKVGKMDLAHLDEMASEYSSGMWSSGRLMDVNLLKDMVSRLSALEAHQEHAPTRKWIWKMSLPGILCATLLFSVIFGLTIELIIDWISNIGS